MAAQKIISYVKKLSQRKDIGEDTLLLEKKVLDSLQLIQLITFLETEFGITIKQQDLKPDYFKSVNTIVKLVKKTKKALSIKGVS